MTDERDRRILLLLVIAMTFVIALPRVVDAHAAGAGAKTAAVKKKAKKKVTKKKRTQTTQLAAPSQESPADGVSVMVPAPFTWKPVKGAFSYEIQVAADAGFGSVVYGSAPGRGVQRTANTAATITGTIPDGEYFWRVRAVDEGDRAGRWSRTRAFFKTWNSPPQLIGPINNLSVPWPLQSVVLRWRPVPHATSYKVTVATDAALSNVVQVNDRPGEVTTQGTQYAVLASLQTGEYFWAVTPLDADGHPGKRSAVGSFQWAWDSKPNNLGWTDLDDREGFSDIQMHWDRVPGAASYEVDVNTSRDFAPGSRWCCDGRTISTTAAMRKMLKSNDYYWRVRAFDALGNGGQWVEGPSFTKSFGVMNDPWVENVDGTPVVDGGRTSGPIVRWDPVRGAASYEVQIAPFEAVVAGGSLLCNWTSPTVAAAKDRTAATAWTVLGPSTSGRPGPIGWPNPNTDALTPQDGKQYCVRVLARADRDARGAEVFGPPYYVNGDNEPAFTFEKPDYGVEEPGGFIALPSDLTSPQQGEVVKDHPIFRWKRIPGARSYFIVIARDPEFTNVIDVGFSNMNAYAPRGSSNPLTYSDETEDGPRPYWWMVIPAQAENGNGIGSWMTPGTEPSFSFDSYAPELLTPTAGELVALQPTFRWTVIPGARTYRVQISEDSQFSKLLDDTTVSNSSYTSDSTLPADAELFWRVRGNDETGKGMRWSPSPGQPQRRFLRRLAIPFTATGLPAAGERVPLLAWDVVPGAVAYEVHVDETDGDVVTGRTVGTAATPIAIEGTGVWSWKVRARFPTLRQPVNGPWSESRRYTRNLDAPANARAIHTSTRTLLTWTPDSAAHRYKVEISQGSGFATVVERVTVSSSNYAPELEGNRYLAGGTFHWRVASMDHGKHTGAFATGAFNVLGFMQVGVKGLARTKRRSSLEVVALGAQRRTLSGARVEMRVRGLKRQVKRTGRNGSVKFRFTPRYRGQITFRVTKKGYREASKVALVR